MKRWPFLVLAAAGIALSVWLEVLHVRAYTQPSATSFCTVGEKLDCTTVALSRWSVLLGVPVPIWGALGFLAIGTAAFLRSRWLLVLSLAAAVVSAALLVLELTVIGAVCLLCEGVHLVSFALAALAFRGRKKLDRALLSRDDVLLCFGPAVGIALSLALFLPPYWGVYSWKGEPPFARGTTPEGYPWLGAQNPKVTVHEFTDYACPHCRVASARNLKRLAAHQDVLRIVRRQYPRTRCTSKVPTSCGPVRAAQCAGEQGKFWQMDRWLFEYAGASLTPDYQRASREIGLDHSKLSECMRREESFARADGEARLAQRKRIPGTPTYIVGDKRVTEQTIDAILAEH